MISWKAYGTDGYKATYFDHTLIVTSHRDNIYNIEWRHNGGLLIDKKYEFASMDKAKEAAIKIVRKRINESFTFWKNLRDDVCDWTEEPFVDDFVEPGKHFIF